MAAYWYGQMGFKHVSVLQGGLEAWPGSGGKLVTGVTAAEPLGFDLARRSARIIDATKLRQLSSEGSLILDVSTSLNMKAPTSPEPNGFPVAGLTSSCRS